MDLMIMIVLKTLSASLRSYSLGRWFDALSGELGAVRTRSYEPSCSGCAATSSWILPKRSISARLCEKALIMSVLAMTKDVRDEFTVIQQLVARSVVADINICADR